MTLQRENADPPGSVTDASTRSSERRSPRAEPRGIGEAGPAPKVVLIMGRGRSGSTLLDNLLGEFEGFFSAGEVHNLWKRGLAQRRKCGCGRSLPECSVWSSVLARASLRARPLPAPQQVIEWQEKIVQPRNEPRLLRVQDSRGAGWDELDSYVSVLGAIYRALADVTGARVVIDSSKRPTHGMLLELVPGITPYFIHLVRDPRAVAFSRRRIKHNVDRNMRQHTAWHSASLWRKRNRVAQAIVRRAPHRSMVLRYEDFVARPEEALTAITALVGEQVDGVPFLDGRSAVVDVNHSTSGNPSRFRSGRIDIRADDEWRAGQRALDRTIVTALTLPSLRHYGYPIRVPRRREGSADVHVSA